MNSIWASDKTQLHMDTLKAILVTKVAYGETCAELFKMLLEDKDFLEKIQSSNKYGALILLL